MPVRSKIRRPAGLRPQWGTAPPSSPCSATTRCRSDDACTGDHPGADEPGTVSHTPRGADRGRSCQHPPPRGGPTPHGRAAGPAIRRLRVRLVGSTLLIPGLPRGEPECPPVHRGRCHARVSSLVDQGVEELQPRALVDRLPSQRHTPCHSSGESAGSLSSQVLAISAAVGRRADAVRQVWTRSGGAAAGR